MYTTYSATGSYRADDGQMFFSPQRRDEHNETLRAAKAAAVQAEQVADVLAEQEFETQPEHL